MILLGFFLAYIGSCASVRYAAGSTKRRSVAQQSAASVGITNLCVHETESGKRYKIGGGSGVIVSPNDVITANHVIDCGNADIQVILVTREDSQVFDATIIARSTRADIARLEVDGHLGQQFAHPPVVSRAYEGMTVCAEIAVPSRERRCGKVISIRSKLPGNIKHTPAAIPGNSGSAVYDRHGFFVGILTHRALCSSGNPFQFCYTRSTSVYGRGWILP